MSLFKYLLVSPHKGKTGKTLRKISQQHLKLASRRLTSGGNTPYSTTDNENYSQGKKGHRSKKGHN